MQPIQYVGEHLWIGRILHAVIIIGFLASINAAYAYFKSAKYQDGTWVNYAKWSYILQGFMVFGTMGLIFFGMINHYYEYEYVREHISDDLAFKYVFSAFWSGQEGSFLLWMFWNVILGFVLIKTAGRWEAPVMALMSLLHVFLFSMLLGIYFGWGENVLKVGSSPSLLVREMFSAPIFQNADYVKLLKGSGLNPLLQNYWMTIHPPTLFLGFSSTIVPFLFAYAGWYYKDPKSWLKPAQEWALFSGFILGLGILMGGAWAYESLSFGGYWAWDPVENMSLVPWIMIIAGLHTNVIARATGRAINTTYLYYLLGFVLMLYSSYMTRSGVLGDNSVHAFTATGLDWQLLALLGTFIGLGIYQYIKNKSILPQPTEEEKMYSREYWMFIGSMVLLFSSLLITISTSLPVFNKVVAVFIPEFKGQVIVDPVDHHNRFQLWIGVLICLLSSVAEFLRFKEGHWADFKSRFLKLIGISIVSTILLFLFTYKMLNADSWQFFILMFAGIFSIFSNITYLFAFLRGKIKLAASALAHFGFGLMILGILATGLNKKIISTNLFAQQDLIQGFEAEDYMKNLVLIKNAPMTIAGYEVTYKGDTMVDAFNREFNIKFDQKDAQGKTVKSINSNPTLVYGRDEAAQPSSNPSVYRTLANDLFTYVNWLPPQMMNPAAQEKLESELNYQPFAVTLNDTFFYDSGFGILKSISNLTNHPDYEPKKGDQILSCLIELRQLNDSLSYMAEPAIISRGDLYYTLPYLQNDLGIKVRINPSSLDAYYPSSDAGKDAVLKENEEVTLDGYKLKFTGFDKQISKDKYASHSDDIAVAANLSITTPSGKTMNANPIFCIRNKEIKVFSDFLFDEHLKLSCYKIDPQTESVSIKFLKYETLNLMELEVTENAPRNDMIVIQSILFPGINMFWFGSLIMLGGILLSGFRRWIKN